MRMSKSLFAPFGAVCLGIAALTSVGCGGGGTSVPASNSSFVSGRVVNATDPTQPVGNAAIELVNPSTGQTLSIEAAPDGTFRINGVPVGTWKLRVDYDDDGEIEFEIEVEVDDDGVSANDVGMLPSGATVSRIEIVAPVAQSDGTLELGEDHHFTARVFDQADAERNWRPNWRVEGNIGTISAEGEFMATALGTGAVVAYFGAGEGLIEQRITVTVGADLSEGDDDGDDSGDDSGDDDGDDSGNDGDDHGGDDDDNGDGDDD